MQAILDTFGVDTRLLVIQAINFGFLLVLLWYFLYAPLTKLIDTRRAKIEKGVQDAESAETKLAEVEESKEGIIKKATTEAEEIVGAARSRGYEKEAELVKDAQEKSERILADAQAKAEESKRQAIAESQSEIARLAVLGAEKVLRKES